MNISKRASKKSIKQFARYIITGTTAAAADYLLFTFFCYFVFAELNTYVIQIKSILDPLALQVNIQLDPLSLQAVLANIVAYFITFWYVFFLNRHWTFRSSTNVTRQLILYLLLFLFNLLVVQICFMYILSGVFGVSPRIAKLFLMIVIVFWNFIIYKNVIYTQK